MNDSIKVVPYDSATGQMTYDLVMFNEGEPEMIGRLNDIEIANQVALFLEAFLDGTISVPAEMTTMEFHAMLVQFGIYGSTSSRATIYARIHRLGLKPVKVQGRSVYYSRRQLVSIVRDKFPKAYESMAAAVMQFGRIYSLMKRSIA